MEAKPLYERQQHRVAPALDKKQHHSKGVGSKRTAGTINLVLSPAEQHKTLHFSSAGCQRPAGQGKALCTQVKYNQVLCSWCIDLSKKQGGGKKGQDRRGEIKRQGLSLCFGAGQP